jgi:hypothetical protein
MATPMAPITETERVDSAESALSPLAIRYATPQYLKNINFRNNYFLESLIYGFSPNLGQQVQQRNKIFVISRESFIADDDTNLWKYTSIADYSIQITRQGDNSYLFSYSEEEKQRLQSLYGDEEPVLQIDLDETPTRADIGIQNSVVGEQISYNSLSSLGAISQEGFTISATTGSVTGLITEEAETITDVGGLSGAGRDRTIESTDAVITTPFGVITGTRTVTTRGY